MFVVSTRNFPPDLGGIQNLMEGLSNSLVEHGPVKVFADSNENDKDFDKNSKLNIKRISGFKIFRKYRKANMVNDFVKNNEIRAIFIDHWKSIEHINQETLNKTKSFCLIHSKEINHPTGSSLNLRMLKALSKASYIISNSQFTKDLAVSLGVKNNQIKIINPGTNYPIQIKDDYKAKADSLYQDSFPKIITVARLDRRKGHQNILMTLKNLKPKFPKLRYISIGDGDEKNRLQQLKKELNLGDEVIFIHNADEDLKNALLNKCDLFLMPSIIYKKSIEGFGISFIEAASYAKGSIGGNCGGEKDAIKDDVTGYICDGDDLNSVYEKTIKFFENDNYKRLGANAQNFYKNFKWKIIIKKYLDLI